MNTIEPEVSRLLCKINTIESLVDRVFRNHELTRGQCENPVIGGYYVGGEDPIGPQKRMVHCALLAREWFVVYGPHDASPLPLSDEELEDLKYTDPFSHIVSSFGYSLRAHDWDFNTHPSFEDFARGVMASQYAPDFVRNDKALGKRYKLRPLRGLGPGLCWQSDQ